MMRSREPLYKPRTNAASEHPIWFWEKDREVPEPVATDKSADWHVEHLAQFASVKAAIGEPSPHMKMVVWLTDGLPVAERLWRGGCYLNAYSVGTGEKIWESWSYADAKANPEGLAKWITENWAGFHTRTERRMVRSPANFVKAQLGIIDWIQYGVRELLSDRSIYDDPKIAYDRWWGVANKIPFFGRYINIRLVEYVNRVLPQLGLDLYDIRAIGGWSPIRALTMFRPEKTAQLMTGMAEPVNLIANEVLADVRTMAPMVTYYTFAALLCEVREAYEDRNHFPGHTIDQELKYASSPKFDHWPTRPHAR